MILVVMFLKRILTDKEKQVEVNFEFKRKTNGCRAKLRNKRASRYNIHVFFKTYNF